MLFRRVAADLHRLAEFQLTLLCSQSFRNFYAYEHFLHNLPIIINSTTELKVNNKSTVRVYQFDPNKLAERQERHPHKLGLDIQYINM